MLTDAPQVSGATTFTKLEPGICWRIAPDPRTTTLTEGCGVRIDNRPLRRGRGQLQEGSGRMTTPYIDKWAEVVRAARKAYKAKLRIEKIKRLAYEATPEWHEYDNALTETREAREAMLRAEELAETEGGVFLPWE